MLEKLLGRGILSPRADRFLRLQAEPAPSCRPSEVDDAQVADCAAFYGVSSGQISMWLGELNDNFSGIRYRSLSWSFDEVIEFFPSLDFDESDAEPMVNLVKHTVAHPFGVWNGLGGGVYYMYPTVNGGEYLKVFDRPEYIIESDSIYFECSQLPLIARGGAETSRNVFNISSRQLPEIPCVSGMTEKWWQGDGFRVHVWDTWARLFQQPSLSKWAVWAESEAAAAQARSFLRGLP